MRSIAALGTCSPGLEAEVRLSGLGYVVASCALDERSIEEVSQGNEEVRRILTSAPPATSMILGPQGELLAEPQVGGEGMVVAEIDLSLSIEQKQFHDIANRPADQSD